MSWTWEIDEEWSDVPGAIGRIWVSTHGRAYRYHVQWRRGQMVNTESAVVDRWGYGRYRTVAMPKEGGYRGIHILVVSAFRGRRPLDAMARHLNDDRANNFLGNVAWGTPSQNQQDRVRNALPHNTMSPQVWRKS